MVCMTLPWRKGDSNSRSLSQSKRCWGTPFGDPRCAAAIPRGTVAAIGVMSLTKILAADLRHRAQPCSGCAGNFRSRHLIPGGAVSALLEGFHRR